jgi:hypothetical protein
MVRRPEFLLYFLNSMNRAARSLESRGWRQYLAGAATRAGAPGAAPGKALGPHGLGLPAALAAAVLTPAPPTFCLAVMLILTAS